MIGEPPAPAGGVAIVTDVSGSIIEVLHADFELLDPSGTVHHLSDLADDADSAGKIADFLATAASDGAAFAWEMRVRGLDDGAPLRFSAVRDHERLVVLVALDREDVGHLVGEMLQINNEQTNSHRSHLKDAGSAPLSMTDLEQFTQVNNDLANLQRELAKANGQLAELNVQKDRFLGMAAHELRSPLGVISTYAQFLDDEAELDAEQRRMISTIRRTIVAMRQLVDELLDVVAIEAGRLVLDPALVDLVEVVAEVAERHAPQAVRKSVRLALDTPDEPVVAVADRAKLVQVLDNLVANAIKFTHAGGSVTIGATDPPGGGSTVEVSVTDDGIGIPETAVGALFDPFSTSRTGTAGEPGTGLGLAIVKRIVDGHGGTIDVRSEPGQGTTVTVRLPR